MSKLYLTPVNELITPAPGLVGADEKPLKLSDSKKEALQLGQTFASVRQITESCAAIRNTFFTPPSVKPKWFDELDHKLEVVKGQASIWLDDYAAAVTAAIPSSIMNFVPVFDACANRLRIIIREYPDELPTDAVIIARELINRMAQGVIEIENKVGRYARTDSSGRSTGLLIEWQKNMRNAKESLQVGSTDIQDLYVSLEAEVKKYNGYIDTLRAEITAYNKQVATGAGLLSGGLGVGVIGGALCFCFPALGGITIAVGAAAVIGGSVTWGVMRSKINQANDQIAELERKIAEEERTVVSLKGLSTASNNAVASADSAVMNMLNFSATWINLGEFLIKTYNELEQGGKEAAGALLALNLEAAQEEWDYAKGYAQKLLDVPTDIKVVPAGQRIA